MSTTAASTDASRATHTNTVSSPGTTGATGATTSTTGATAGADTASGPAATAKSAAPEDPEALIAGERVRIDQLDTRILGLVRDRMEISENIQRIRVESGGRRVHLSREMEILDHYSTELGRSGRDLAMTLLSLCRGHGAVSGERSRSSWCQ